MGEPWTLLSPIWGVIVIAALAAMYSVVATGRRRRDQWSRRVQALDSAAQAPTEAQIRQAERTERAMDFLGLLSRRTYYVIMVLSALILIVLPSIPLELSTKFVVWLVLTGTTLVGSLLLLASWHGWGDEREQLLRKRLRQARERALARRGLPVRDALTGLYTPEFWLHALGLQAGKIIRRPTPITCLVIEVVGLAAFRQQHGDPAADGVLAMVGQEITRSVRANDILCRCGDQRFAVALLRCPIRYGGLVGERVTNNVTRLILDGVNYRYDSCLQLAWRTATLPDEALTPMQLLRVTEQALAQSLSATVG